LSVNIKDQKMLWGRAAGRCSHPECRNDLYEAETEDDDDDTHIGENCHIVGEKTEAARGISDMLVEKRNKYSNLILLCRNHHKIVDAQEKRYTVELLHKWKSEHESWVQTQLAYDADKVRDDERYAAIVEEWQNLAHIHEWDSWSSWLLSSGQPILYRNVDADLSKLRTWLLNRVWPSRYPTLEAAFHNFRRVLSDLQNTFHKHTQPYGSDAFMTKKFYKEGDYDDYDQARYIELGRRFDHHVDLVEDLMLELTRAANLVCDEVRKHILRHYRLLEGHLFITTGPDETMSWKQAVVQYSQEERLASPPYPGLEPFMTARADRDMTFGKGPPP